MPQDLKYNPSTDDSYTDKEARKDRARVGAVRQTTPEQGYKEYVTKTAETTAALTAANVGGWTDTKHRKAGRKDR